MKSMNTNVFIFMLVTILVLFLALKLFKIKIKVSLDLLNVKMRVQIYLFGFLRLINLKIYYANCAINLEKNNGKISKLKIKPMNKFETKMGINVAKLLSDNKLQVNALAGILDDAQITALLCGSVLTSFGSLGAIAVNKQKADLLLNLDSTTKDNVGKMFLRFDTKTSIARIFRAVLLSI